jgi:REP element-mobilizing transposase RayT
MREHEIPKSSRSNREWFDGKHRFEHWYLDNQVYFITARCRDRFPAFATEEARKIFWDRFDHYASEFGFFPWVTSLLNNHYHTLGYLREGKNLKRFIQRLHGSTAKLVNDLLEDRRDHFWSDHKGKEYFDGCIRDEKQCRATYRYVRSQARRHGLMYDCERYPHTHTNIDLEKGIKRAHELRAFLQGVGYRRYER